MIPNEPVAEELVGDEALETPSSPIWRRVMLPLIAIVTAVSLAMIPVYNLLDTNPPLADNGLEVCGFDYCVVQEALRGAGLDLDLSRLANTFLDDEEAQGLAHGLAAAAGAELTGFVIVDRLEGDIKGQFDPATGTIYVERPIRAWIVVHEVAHLLSPGHGPAFQEALIGLTRSLGD